MNSFQLLSMGAVGCLTTAAVLARSHLRTRRGLRFIFAGLLLAGLCSVAISFSPSLLLVRLFAAGMLVGIALVMYGAHDEHQPQRPKAPSLS